MPNNTRIYGKIEKQILDKHNLNFEDVFMGHTHEFTGTHFFVVEIPEDAVWTKTKST